MAGNYTVTGQVPVGTILKINENGSPVDYIVVNQGIPQNSPLYDNSCDGTWLLRKDIYANNVWNDRNNVNYKTSAINGNYLPNKILSLYDVNFQNIIKQVKIPYLGAIVESGENGVSTQLFLLGVYEVGWTINDNRYYPIDGAVLSYFQNTALQDSKRIANFNGNPYGWWLRSPIGTAVNIVTSIGSSGGNKPAATNGVRPAMIVPSSLFVDPNNNIVVLSFSITVPQVFMENQSIPIYWQIKNNSIDEDITYIIERNTGDNWIQIADNISNNFYNDTAGTNWTQVQYRITPVINGESGIPIESDIIPGVESAIIAISGINQDLGTLTSNVPYTVVSNTGNPISLTHTVNGAQVVTLTVDSGFAYNIPIADLPTGTGTIQITASVEDTSQQIQTATRTWTYYKTPINIPSTGGIAQLTQNGQNIWPVTVPDAIEAPTYLGGDLNAALNLLGQAALYKTSPSAGLYDISGNLLLSLPVTRIQTGTYVGIGTYGNMNQTVINLNFSPKIVFISEKGKTSNRCFFPYLSDGILWQDNELDLNATLLSLPLYATWESNEISWYSDRNESEQMNKRGTTYQYMVLG